MKVLKDGRVELQRGNIHLILDQSTVKQGIRRAKEKLKEEERLRKESFYDPDGYMVYPDLHKTRANAAPRWTGSGAHKVEHEVRTSYMDAKTEHGLTVNPGIHSLADFLAQGGKIGR